MADDQSAEDVPIPVPVLWVGLDEEPVVLVNQFLGQVQQDEIVLSFGAMVHPPITGSDLEERREQVMRISHVPVRPVLRFTMTRRRVEELQTMLRDTLEIFDKRYGGGGETDG
ncbi:MAG: hypothetical protein M3P96_04430 [Actinomycetota bacterium]|nr:hypothetical protein [Actinomycetota bacterium]